MFLFCGTVGLWAQQTKNPTPAEPSSANKATQGAETAAGTNKRAEMMAKFLAIGSAPDPAKVQKGKQIFTSTCGFCHGAMATGGETGPNLVRSVLVLHDDNGSNIGTVILHGRPGKGMPAFSSMTPEQISDIAAFLKSRIQAAANRGSYQIQNLITGDASEGKAYFDGNGKCSTCHSVTGDLAGVAKKYEPDVLISLILYPVPPRETEADLPAAARPKAVVTDAKGQTVSGILEHLDDFNVAVQDDAGNYHSWERDGNVDDGIKIEVHDPLQAHVDIVKNISNKDLHNVLTYLESLK
jgi:mono/diheme cytochrome c family protein